MPTDELILAAMAGLETTWSFSAFNPSVFTIEHFDAEADLIRKGYTIGLVFSMGFAAFVAWLMARENRPLWWLPIATSAALSAAFIAVYEAAIARAL